MTTARLPVSLLARIPWERIGLPLFILLMGLFFGSLNPNFFSGTNFSNVARQSSVLALISVGQTFAIVSGGIDLSVGSLLAIVSVLGSMQLVALGLGPGIAGGIAVATVAGAINGALISRTRIPPFIVTLGMLSLARGLAFTVSGGMPVVDLPAGIGVIGAGNVGPLPVPGLIALAAFGGGHWLLTYTPFGRYVYAMGGNEPAAIAAGIDVRRYKLLAYCLSGLCAGVAGIVITSRTLSGQPTVGETLELYAIAAVVIGGTRLGGGDGSLVRTLFGVVVIAILGNGLNLINVSSYIQLIVIGIIIIVAVQFDLWRRERRR
ncbi:MAG: ABC transporter permease [Candidatus Rokubacteria bacterium]|nr:ABC transporter permease [Candidatus Rokubacteria bacterium]